MLILGLLIGVLIAVGVVFLVVKSLVIKLLSLLLLVFALVLVLAFTGNKLQESFKPIAIEDNVVQVYQDGEPVQFKVKEVTRVDVTNDPEGGKKVTFTVEGFLYSTNVSGLGYGWVLKNELNKHFSKVIYDATF